MQMGAGRPLCCFSWLFSIAVAFYIFVCPDTSALLLAVLVSTFLIAVFSTLALLWKRWRFRFVYVAFLLLGFLLGLFSSLLYQHFAIRPARYYVQSGQNDTVQVSGLVVSYEIESNYVNAYGVRAQLPDGGNCMLYLNVTGERELLSVGDMICTEATVCFVTEADEPSWFIRHLRAEGYLLVAQTQEMASEEILGKGHFVFREWLAGLRDQFSYRLTQAVKGEQGALVSALLLGTRSELSDMTALDFRRAGALHLLALSGLHLSMIVLMLDSLLRFLRCPYRLRAVLLSLVSVIFLLLTGCSISMLRATVMLLFLSVSRMLGSPYDVLTPISVFFAVCLAVRPTWILDVGLWMTVLATLAVAEIIPALIGRRNGVKKASLPARLLGCIGTSLGASVIVILVLMIPMALTYGEFSWLSPLSNLLLTPLTAVILGLGLIALPLLYIVDVVPFLECLSDWLTDTLHALADAMLRLVHALSDVNGALISLRYDFVPYLLAILAVAFLLFLLFKWNKPRRFIGVIMIWCIMFGTCLLVTHIQSNDHWQVTYTVHGKSELLTLNEGERTVLCDLSDGSYTTYRALLDDGLPKGTTEIEALVLTHYHQRHIASVYKLLGDCRVRTIFLPLTMPDATQDKAVQDEGVLRSIAALAKERRVQVRYYLPSEGADITDTLSLEGLYYDMLKRSMHPVLATCWSYRRNEQHTSGHLVLLGASVWEGEDTQRALTDAATCDALILSGHGPIVKSSYSVSMWSDGPRVVLFADGNAATALKADAGTAEVLRNAALYFADRTHTTFDLP